jgi:hypothetical protein
LINEYKQYNKDKQIIDIYSRINQLEKKTHLRLQTTKFISSVLKQWQLDPQLQIFTVDVGKEPYFDITKDSEFIPIFTQVWQDQFAKKRYFGFFCNGPLLANIATIQIDISLLLSLFDGESCYITSSGTTWTDNSITLNDIYFLNPITYTQYIIQRQQALPQQIVTYSASDYGKFFIL